MLSPERLRMLEDLAQTSASFDPMRKEIARRNAAQQSANASAAAAAQARSRVRPGQKQRTTSKLSLQTPALRNQ